MSLTGERFDPKKWAKLEAPERRARMAPAANTQTKVVH